LRAFGGKGSPKDIFEETEALLHKNHVDVNSISDEALKKFLTDQNIGIDCSAFAYYVLNAQSEELGRGALDKHISFVNCHGLIGKMRCSLRPVENCDVSTLAHDKNSRIISIKEAVPGDMITMLSTVDGSDRDHILVIHQVEYQNFITYKLHYSHAVAYPTDGLYGSGVRQGVIEIIDTNKSITEQVWTENGTVGENNLVFVRAKKSKVEVRRLKWL
jgi:hypothetical protein